jgi:alkylhydroperoxidase/carboxymuconolactone decarboxylase family protein YurZ
MSGDVREALSAAQLEALRGGYDRATMHLVATKVVVGPYPPLAGLAAFAADRFYCAEPPVLAHANRERALLLLFAADRRPAFALAVHVYWALMEGLEVDEVAELLLLGAVYGGLDAYTDAMRVLQQTLGLLAKAADEGGDGLASGRLLPALVAAFRA